MSHTKSTQWTNKYAIMRDLSMVQGCVPVDPENMVAAGDRPPSQNIVEETEEEFFRGCTADGELPDADCGLIKQMIDMVRDQEVSPQVENDPVKVLQVSKFNPFASEFLPLKGSGDCIYDKKEISNKTSVRTKIKKHKNVAVESLLKIIDGNISAKNNAAITERRSQKDLKRPSPEIKLLKPCNFELTQIPKKPVKDVGLKTKPNLKPTVFMMQPSSMFKKRDIITPKTVSGTAVEKKSPIEEYVPSPEVADIMKRFERQKLQQVVREDVWTKVERQMKEIDERRRLEAELFASSVQLPSNPEETEETECKQLLFDDSADLFKCADFDDQKLSIVRLPQHRHRLPGAGACACVVCQVMCANKAAEIHKRTMM